MASTALASLLSFITGCASTPPPKETISKAEISISNADRAGAAAYEPELLSSARAKLNQAHKQVDEDENKEAGRLAEEALAEAMLANAKTEAAKQAKQLEDMRKTIEALKQEASRENSSQ
ncbi:DUF4398 domain-containing protein [Methylosarcina fibrata]|uniref:DUF4398 domain-containing protein n=1 Tax=Methylosarcina fibrata TaxID=105972 RepID=UPI0006876428|nr:DUF4398 domain-containing protein [Methylosarcina fibrata]